MRSEKIDFKYLCATPRYARYHPKAPSADTRLDTWADISMGVLRFKPLTVKETEKLTANRLSTINHRALGRVPGFVCRGAGAHFRAISQ